MIPKPSTPQVVPDPFPEIVGRSAAVRGLLHSVATAARADYPILIEGESGTGKELVARAIHRLSRRSQKPFVCENCAALPENLFESECFGHEKGAFTGAVSLKTGIFERAQGGTVFLDEVGELDPPMQRKLLRVLQEKQVRRLGGEDTIPVDFRVISATNRVLEQMVLAGGFRKDLYYRLNVATIAAPPLRERIEDIPLLLRHFCEGFVSELGVQNLEFTDAALEALLRYPWPGNIRELRNEALRLACTGRRVVDVDALSRRILVATALLPLTLSAASAARPLAEVEREAVGGAILAALRSSGGNRTEAARRLGITRAALYRRLVRYRLLAAAVVDAAEPLAQPQPPLAREG